MPPFHDILTLQIVFPRRVVRVGLIAIGLAAPISAAAQTNCVPSVSRTFYVENDASFAAIASQADADFTSGERLLISKTVASPGPIYSTIGKWIDNHVSV